MLINSRSKEKFFNKKEAMKFIASFFLLNFAVFSYTKYMMTGTRTNIIYGNYVLRSKDGIDLCRVTEKRANWYADRGLGEFTSKDPLVFQLNFETNGASIDDFTLSKKINQCVVCGVKDLAVLTKHHVVPYEYRKHFPIEIKSRSSHDVVVVCNKHHSEYEGTHALHLKRKLISNVKVPLQHDPKYIKMKKLKIASELSKILLDDNKNIPMSRFMELVKRIEKYMGHEPTFEDLENFAEMNITIKKNIKSDGELVVENIKDLQEFVIMWRQHFIETMKPGFMPEGWNVERDILVK